MTKQELLSLIKTMIETKDLEIEKLQDALERAEDTNDFINQVFINIKLSEKMDDNKKLKQLLNAMVEYWEAKQ